jgi:ABC-type sulfate/molybdate transport systems ATPase subunit
MSVLEFDITWKRPESGFILSAKGRYSSGIHVVVGASASGKSSFARALLGLDKSIEGRINWNREVWLHSELLQSLKPQQRGVGYVPQNSVLFLEATVQKNISFGCRQSSEKKFAETIEFHELVDAFGLSPLLNRKARTLSGGQRQRVCLARAFAASPRFLVLDEPFAALDPPSRQELSRLLKEKVQQFQIPCLHITHDAFEALALADELSFMDKGELSVGVNIETFLQSAHSFPELCAHLFPQESLGWKRLMAIQKNLSPNSFF